jgi:hypothetical protein
MLSSVQSQLKIKDVFNKNFFSFCRSGFETPSKLMKKKPTVLPQWVDLMPD